MSDFDKDVRDAMEEGGSPTADLAREQGFREMIAATFRGRNRWMTILVWVYLWAFTALGVVVAVLFFRSDALADKLMYAAIFVVVGFFLGMMKMWYWMLMNRNAVVREVKRLELRISELQAALEKR
jgi:hypothetical protein